MFFFFIWTPRRISLSLSFSFYDLSYVGDRRPTDTDKNSHFLQTFSFHFSRAICFIASWLEYLQFRFFITSASKVRVVFCTPLLKAKLRTRWSKNLVHGGLTQFGRFRLPQGVGRYEQWISVETCPCLGLYRVSTKCTQVCFILYELRVTYFSNVWRRTKRTATLHVGCSYVSLNGFGRRPPV